MERMISGHGHPLHLHALELGGHLLVTPRRHLPKGRDFLDFGLELALEFVHLPTPYPQKCAMQGNTSSNIISWPGKNTVSAHSMSGAR